MVVIHRAFGIKFVIYTNDHEPAHIHVKGEGLAKINLVGPDGQPELISAFGFKSSELRRIMMEVMEHKAKFLNKWEQIHGNLD